MPSLHAPCRHRPRPQPVYPAIVALVAVAASVLLPTAVAAAPAREDGLFLSLGLGLSRGQTTRNFSDGDREAVDHGLNSGVLRAGYHLSGKWIWDLGLQLWTESDGGFERQDLRTVTTTVSIHDSGGFYARLGGGWGRLEVTLPVPDGDDPGPGGVVPETTSAHALTLTGGLGYRHFFNERLAASVELEGSYLRASPDLHALFGSLNVALQAYVF